MGTSLSGLTPANTYQALIKVGDNSALSATLKILSDGAGNDSVLALSTVSLQIGGATGATWDNTNKRLGVGTNAPSATGHIKGSGSTSATSSLLVQNSAGNTAFQVKDDLNANFQGRIQIEYDKISFLGNPSNTYIQQSLGTGIGFYSAALSNQIMINAQPKIIVKDTGASLASTLIVGHNVPTTDAADPSALLEVRSAATYLKGFLRPRMTTTQRDAIVSPATGLSVYNTTLRTNDTYDGATWQRSGQQTLIKGSGSTSATTSLLVQNSGGTRLLQVSDDGRLDIGTTASGLGAIYVPRSSTFGDRNFLFNQDGTALMYTRSNDLMGFNTTVSFNADIGVVGNYRTKLRLTTTLSAASSTDSLIINSGTTWSTQTNGTCIGINLQPIIDTNTASLTAKYIGFYWNPDISDLQLATHYGIQTTSGGAYINTATPNASAALQADSTTQGFLPPRMTTAQKVTLAATAAAGLMIYDTNLNKLCVYTGAGWETITSI